MCMTQLSRNFRGFNLLKDGALQCVVNDAILRNVLTLFFASALPWGFCAPFGPRVGRNAFCPGHSLGGCGL